MNRHETHPVRGRVFDEAHARADLIMMKQPNVNAIRTSHYPPHPRVLDLADELGLLGDRRVRSGDPRLRLPRLAGQSERRSRGGKRPTWTGSSAPSSGTRTIRRSIIWSLGNESGTGGNLAQMANWVRAVIMNGRCTTRATTRGAYTDVYSRMYPNLLETAAIGGETGPCSYLRPGRGGARAQQAVPALRVRARDGQRSRRTRPSTTNWPSAIRGCTAASSGSGVIMVC